MDERAAHGVDLRDGHLFNLVFNSPPDSAGKVRQIAVERVWHRYANHRSRRRLTVRVGAPRCDERARQRAEYLRFLRNTAA